MRTALWLIAMAMLETIHYQPSDDIAKFMAFLFVLFIIMDIVELGIKVIK